MLKAERITQIINELEDMKLPKTDNIHVNRINHFLYRAIDNLQCARTCFKELEAPN